MDTFHQAASAIPPPFWVTACARFPGIRIRATQTPVYAGKNEHGEFLYAGSVPFDGSLPLQTFVQNALQQYMMFADVEYLADWKILFYPDGPHASDPFWTADARIQLNSKDIEVLKSWQLRSVVIEVEPVRLAPE